MIPTITIALLGAIESLLCARVADNLIDAPRHDPNQELMAQGIANFVAPFFGGIPATGTIARTVTNVRAGATSPVAGIVHALTLLAIVLVAAPLAAHVPLAVLAGILLFVAWNMGEWHEFARLRDFPAALPHDPARHLPADGGVRPDGGGAGRSGAGLRVLHLPHLAVHTRRAGRAVPADARPRRRGISAVRLAVLRRCLQDRSDQRSVPLRGGTRAARHHLRLALSDLA